MIRATIHEWLSAIYGLTIVEDINQTKVEQAISFDLTGFPIEVRIEPDDSIKFSFSMAVHYRCSAGFPGIGFLSLGLADLSKRPPGFNLASGDAAEVVEYDSKTEMIISKVMRGFIVIQYDKARELIKCIEFDDGLDCQESCN